MVAYNEFGCTDTVCTKVVTLIKPVVDVPSAFTPNGDGKNDKVFVRGFGIAQMNFRIYNRLGQVVFESGSPSDGWDGKFKGALQPMDAYANWWMDCATWTYLNLWFLPHRMPGLHSDVDKFVSQFTLNGIKSSNICRPS
jgi:gliding motility-associated-like protein